MTTSPTHPRPITALALTIAAWLTLTPGGAFSGEPIQPTASMAVARRGHTATVLSDGRVLIVGGLDASGPLAAAEIFDPAQKTFSSAGNLVNARYGHTATLLTNGRVLIAGGQDASGALASAEIFDPADTNGFRLLAATMGAGRAGHTATVRRDGTVLLAGGDTAGTAEIFDPATESFYAPLLPMMSPRSGHTATPLADDNLFLVGGGTASIELFNAASNSFSLWPNGLSQIRSGHASIPTPDSKLLVIGGDASGTFDSFDPTAGSSLLSLSLGTPSTTANLLANNQILVLGPGVSGLFDETTSQLSPLVDTNASLLQLSGHTATELPTANKQILVAGGIDNSNNLLSSATLYNPAQISTDAGDYPPFSWVNIYGSGFLPNETVTNQVEQIQGPAAGTAYAPWGVNADTNGAFTTLWQVFSEDLADTTLKLTAVGQSSGLKAEVEFTDSTAIQSVTLNDVTTPITVLPGAAITASVTDKNTANSTWASTSWAISTTPPPPSTCVNTTDHIGNGTFSESFTITAPTTPGDYNAYFIAYTDNACSLGASSLFTMPGVVLVRLASTTTVASSANPSVYGGSVHFTTTVSGTGGTPTGTVQFQTNGVNFGSAVAMSGGSATSASVSTLGAGNVAVTAIYSGDPTFGTSTGTLSGGQQINPRPVSLTGTRTYDGTTTAAAAILSVANKVGSDVVTVASSNATLAGKDVGSQAISSFGTLTLGGAAAANYTLTGASGSVTITTKALTASIVGNPTKPYDGSTSATLTSANFFPSGLISGESFTVTKTTGTYNSKDVTTAATVSTALVAADFTAGSDTSAGNYSLPISASGAGHITATPLSASIVGNPTKGYDGTTTATLTSANFSLSGLASGESFTVTKTTGTYNSKDVATATTVSATLAAGDFTAGSGTSASNYSLPTSATGAGQITSKTLTASIVGNPTRPYDGTTSASLAAANFSLSGLASGESFTVTKTSGTYNSKDVATAATVSTTLAAGDFTPGSGTSAANYNLPGTATGGGHITAAPLTASIIGNPTRPYDGTTTATLAPANFSLSGLVSGESFTVTKASGTYNTKNVATATTVSTALAGGDFTAGPGTSASNYSLPISANGAGQITAKTLTASIIGNPTKSYDGTTSATLAPANFSLSGLASGESFTVTKSTGSYDSKDVTAATSVSTALAAGDFTAGSGTSASNYNLPTSASGPGQIIPRTLTASILGNPTKPYDGTSSATLAPVNFSLSGLASGESFTVNKTTGFYNTKDVATATTISTTLAGGDFTAGSGTSANNYALPTTANGPGHITGAPVIASIIGNPSKVYDGTTSATLSPVNFSLSGLVSGESFSVTKTTGSYDSKDVAAATTVSTTLAAGDFTAGPGTAAGNYSLPTSANGAGQISTKSVTAAIIGNPLKAYDGTTGATLASANFSVSGLASGESFSVTKTTGSYDSKDVATATTVSTTLVASDFTAGPGTSAGNYSLPISATGSGHITAALLEVKPNAVSTVYTSLTLDNTAYSDNTGNYSITGFQNGENLVTAGITLSGSMAFNGSTGTPVKGAGTYTQSVGTLTLGSANNNYAMSFSNPAPNNYVITPAALTVTASAADKTYDGTANATVTLSDNHLDGDKVNLHFATALFTDRNVGSPKTVNVSGIFINGPDSDNYTLQNTTTSMTANITPALLTITAVANTKPYDGNTSAAAGPTVSGLQDADTASGVSESYADGNAGTGKTLIPTGTVIDSITHTTSGNYTFSFVNNNSGIINKATLTVTAKDQTKTYGTAFSFVGTEFTIGAGQLVSGDTVSTVTLTSVGAAGTATVGSSPYTITPSAAVGSGLGNYTISYQNAPIGFTVNPKALAITAKNQSKTYGDTFTPDGTTQFSSTGLVNGDTITSVTLASSGYAAAATVTTPGPTYAITPSTAVGTGLGNYSITYNNGTLTINAAALTITAKNESKTYGLVFTPDGTTQFTSSGLVNGDTVTSVTLASSGYAATATVVSPGPTYAITPSAAVGTGLGNYSITYDNGTLAIDAAALTITAKNEGKTYGLVFTPDGTTQFTSSGLVNGDTVTSVALSSSGYAAAATVVAPGPTYAITPSAAVGTGLGNYTITYDHGTLTINAAALTITAKNESKTYGATFTPDGTSQFTSSGLVNGDTVTSVTLASSGYAAAATVIAPGPTYAITPSAAVGTGLGNYSIAYDSGTLTIDAAALTITAKNESKTYGLIFTPDGTTQFTSSGLVNGDTVTSVTLSSSGYAAGAAVVAPGPTYAITPSTALGTGLGNYSITYNHGTLTIDAAALTITAQNESKTYGLVFTPDGTTQFTSSGLVNGDTVTSVTLASSGYAAGATVVAPGPTYPITPSAAVGSGLGNYTITYDNGTLTIDAAALTITAKNESKTYGLVFTPDGTTQFTSSGLVNGDTVTSVTLSSSGYAAGATVVSPGPTYAITPSAAVGSGLGNYTITYDNGTLTIDAAPLTVTAKNESKTYGLVFTPDGTTQFTSSGLVNGDTVTSVMLSSSGYAAAATVVAPGPTYAITPSAAVGTGLGNYTITYDNGTLTIDAAPLTVTAKNESKTYGLVFTPDGTTQFTSSGLVNGDTVTSVMLSSSGYAAAATVVAPGPTYAITPSAAVGTGLGNYTITYDNGTLTIDPAALTITAKNESKTYGLVFAPDGTTQFTSSGLVNGDTVTSVMLSSSGYAAAATVVAPGPTYAITPSAAVGTGLGNYTITYDNGTLTIDPAALTITAKNESKTYGLVFTPDGTTQFTSSGLVNGDTVTSVTLSSSGYAATATVVSPGPTYAITPSTALGTGLGNYSITYNNGTLTINAAALTITAKNESKTYGLVFTPDGTTQFTSSGLVNGDTVTSVTLASSGYAAAATVTTPGPTYAITPSAATGDKLGNYSINYLTGVLTVTKALTSTTISPLALSVALSSNVTFTATVQNVSSSAVLPGLTVKFMEGATLLGTGTLDSSGTTTFSTTSLALGVHSITAVCQGDGNFFGSTSPVATITVLPYIKVTFLAPLAGQPVGNKIKVGQVVPHKVDLVNSFGQSVTTGVTVKLKVLGINTTGANTIEQIVEDANGVGTDGTVTCDGILTLVSGHWQFNLDTSNFSDSNTASDPNACYTSTVYVIDNASLATLGSTTITLETGK